MKLLVSLYLTLAVLGFGALSFAQSASPSPTPAAIQDGSSAGQIVDIALADVVSGKYVMAAAALVLLLVYLFRQYALPKLNLGSGVLPYVSLGIGVIIAIASAVTGGVPVAEAVKIALLSGPAASTLWSALLKLVLHKDV